MSSSSAAPTETARPATLVDGGRLCRRPLGDAAAPGGAGPERRVLRPIGPLRARRRHRRLQRAARRRGGTGRRAVRSGARHGRGGSRWAWGEHGGRRVPPTRSPARGRASGPVRSSAAPVSSAARTEADDAARQHQRFGEHDGVVDHQSGRHDDEPAPAELVPACAGTATSPRRPRPLRRRRGSTPARRGRAAP